MSEKQAHGCHIEGNILTTPPTADAEPVAQWWLYEHRGSDLCDLLNVRRIEAPEGQTETPLYTADQLKAYGDARARDAEDKLGLVLTCIQIEKNRWPENEDVQSAIASLQRRIESLKENPNG